MENLTGSISGKVTLTGITTIPSFVGTSDYEQLKNLPQIEGVTLIKNKTFSELGLDEATNQDIIDLFK